MRSITKDSIKDIETSRCPSLKHIYGIFKFRVIKVQCFLLYKVALDDAVSFLTKFSH